jgi:hypothetical protein
MHTRLFFHALEARRLLSATAGDVVLHWNDIACSIARNVPADHRGPTWVSRSFAMVQGAVFDAVNSIDGRYTGYLVDERFPRWASMDAAAAQAARDVLIALYPAQQATLDAELTATLAHVKDGHAEDMGLLAGQLAAQRMLGSRTNDGALVDDPYTPNPDPGHWQPDDMNPTQGALGVHWGSVKPFVLESLSDIVVPPAPALDSPEYTQAYNEVLQMGGNGTTTPTLRSADQTEIGIFWAYDVAPMGTPVVLYNQILKTIAQQQKNSPIENARLFGLANLAMADAAIVTWQIKWQEDIWRPITGIRNGELDGNPDTLADPDWIPLGAPGSGYGLDFTPPFPAYTSGHSGFGAVTFSILQQFYGTDALHFTLASDEYGTLGGRDARTRSFSSFSDAAWENAISRVYLGVHWRFDATAGITLGNQVASRVMDSVLVPEHRQHRLGADAASIPSGFAPISVTLSPSTAVQLVAVEPPLPTTIAPAISTVISSAQSVRAAGAPSSKTLADDLFAGQRE